MFNLPPSARYNPALFSDRARVSDLPSVTERRSLLIDSAVLSYGPLREVFDACLAHYSFQCFGSWALSERHAEAEAALRSFLHPEVWPEAGPVDGTGAPVLPSDAKRNLIIWGLHRTLGSYKSFKGKLSRTNHPAGKDEPGSLAAYRVKVSEDSRLLNEDDFTWNAQMSWMRNCVEGSNRCKTGKGLENDARAALRFLQERGDLEFDMKDKESVVKGKDGIKQRVDILLENSRSVLLIHMKSSQKAGQGFSGLSSRDTGGITEALRAVYEPGRHFASSAIFLGVDWKTEWLGASEDYLLDSDLPELDRKGRVERFVRLFETWPKLDPFRVVGSGKPPATKSVVVVEEEPASPQLDMFACAGFGDKLLRTRTPRKRR